MSLHMGLHTPHETAQLRYMYHGFVSHAPSLYQWLQSSCRSEHTGLHSPQAVGHSWAVSEGGGEGGEAARAGRARGAEVWGAAVL